MHPEIGEKTSPISSTWPRRKKKKRVPIEGKKNCSGKGEKEGSGETAPFSTLFRAVGGKKKKTSGPPCGKGGMDCCRAFSYFSPRAD